MVSRLHVVETKICHYYHSRKYTAENQPSAIRQAKLAILIDADNTRPAIIEGLLNEVAKYGIASVKRIYGDWTSNKLGSWKNMLLEHAMQPIQQFSYTTGKNATDSAMIIDTMDLLYSEKLDGFCIVSSDSDFTRLAARLRESGCIVYGFGEQKTPKAFVTACDKFIYTEILSNNQEESKEELKEVSKNEHNHPPATTKKILKVNSKLINLLHSVVDDLADESGWTHLGGVGTNITNRSSDFDPRNYGFKKLSDLFRAISQFEIKEKPLCVRWKKEC